MATTVGELHKLDALIRVVEQCAPAEKAEFARRHLLEARSYLRAGMPYEYDWTLVLATRTLERMIDTKRRRKAQEILAGLSKN